MLSRRDLADGRMTVGIEKMENGCVNFHCCLIVLYLRNEQVRVPRWTAGLGLHIEPSASGCRVIRVSPIVHCDARSYWLLILVDVYASYT